MTINIEDFKKVEIKIGKIFTAEPVEGSEKLVKLSVDFAEESPRQVISGIAKYFPETNSLVGKKCAFVTNLEQREIMGLVSQAMIVAASFEEAISLFEVSDSIPQGTLVK